MRSTSTKIVLILLTIGGFCLWYFVIPSFVRKQGLKEYKAFYQTNMKGRIVYLSGSSGQDHFQLDNLQPTFTFKSAANGGRNRPFFVGTAEIGDSVIKPAFADTLILSQKSGKRYRYTFNKFE